MPLTRGLASYLKILRLQHKGIQRGPGKTSPITRDQSGCWTIGSPGTNRTTHLQRLDRWGYQGQAQACTKQRQHPVRVPPAVRDVDPTARMLRPHELRELHPSPATEHDRENRMQGQGCFVIIFENGFGIIFDFGIFVENLQKKIGENTPYLDHIFIYFQI